MPLHQDWKTDWTSDKSCSTLPPGLDTTKPLN